MGDYYVLDGKKARFDEGELTPGDTAPYAICMAALKAVGYGEKKSEVPKQKAVTPPSHHTQCSWGRCPGDCFERYN